MTEQEELKPCPKCAGPARFVSFRHQISMGYIQCDLPGCGVQGQSGTAAEAAAHWNQASGYWIPYGVCAKCGSRNAGYEGSIAEAKGYRQVCRGCGHKGPTGDSIADAERLWNLEMKRLHEQAAP